MKFVKLILLSAILITSCTVTKRRYQSGYYVDFFAVKKTQSPNSNKQSLSFSAINPPDTCVSIEFKDGTIIKAVVLSENDKELSYLYCGGDNKAHKVLKSGIVAVRAPGKIIEKESQIPIIQAPPQVIVSHDTVVPQTPNKPLAPVKTGKCDVLIYQDGHEDSVVVKEIGITEIKYKRCNMADGPDFAVRKRDVFMIKFASGTKEIVKQDKEQAESAPPPLPEARRVSPKTTMAGLSLAFSIMGITPLFFIGAVLGIVFGAIYLKDNKADPEMYPNDNVARAGLITGIVVVVLTTLLLVALFTL